MGRRKKEIDIESIDIFSNQELIKKNYYKCDVCSTIVRIPLIKINLSHLLGKASYYRKCKLESINICNNCASSISEIIDNWIINKNKNLEKFV